MKSFDISRARNVKTKHEKRQTSKFENNIILLVFHSGGQIWKHSVCRFVSEGKPYLWANIT